VHLTITAESMSDLVARLNDMKDDRFKLDNVRKIEIIEEFA